MKAIVATKYGSPDVLNLEETEKPAPKDDEVLVKVRAASVNAGDWHLLRADPFLTRLAFGLLRPKYKVLGADIAGRVEAVGGNVTQFQPGDEVFGDLSGDGFGGFAEYVCATEKRIALKPANMSFEQAASVMIAGVTALQALRDKAEVKPGMKVLINGASGGVGTFAVQLGKIFGADVTGVCSTRNIELVRSLGADRVIDYTKEDFAREAQRYDAIIDLVGNRSLTECRRALTPDGKYIMVGGPSGRWIAPMDRALRASVMSWFGKQKMTMMMTNSTQEDLKFLSGLMQDGKLTPVLDRTYKFPELPEAIAYLETGRARGKAVITLE